MGKEYRRGAYDPVAALRNAGRLMGLELVQSGKQLVGGYYITGERHPMRREKMKVFIWKGTVWVQEEGGQCLSLPSWLVQYGGAADYREALRRINGESQAIVWDRGMRERGGGEVKYVSGDVLRGAKAYDLELSPLFRYMCSLFGENSTREVWERYNVTANSRGGTVFWYLNTSGNICHDKICWYDDTGHRIKSLPMGRRYKVGDGYSENPMFGSHLTGEISGILESEKSCLYAACYYGGVWLATGGKGNLRDPGKAPLYPDRDAEEEWSRLGDCVDWYSDWPDCGDHSDLADKIEWLVLNNKEK